MKSLQNILEGIFDIEDNVQNDAFLDEIIFKDPSSDFWKFMGKNERDAEMLLEFKRAEMDIDRKNITFKDECVEIMHNDNPLSVKYNLISSHGILCIGQRNGSGPHPDKITNNAGFNSFKSTQLFIDGFCGELKNCTFEVGPDNDGTYRRMSGGLAKIYSGDQLKFNNVNINFINTARPGIAFDNLGNLPDLDGLKSNAESLILYSASIFDFDGVKKKLEEFFGKGTFKTFSGETKNKTLRNIVAAANNPKKYQCIDPETITPVGKVEDLFGSLKGFKNLKNIIIKSNNVVITFQKTLLFDWVKYLQVISRNAAKTSITELYDKFKQTPDGWYVDVAKTYL